MELPSNWPEHFTYSPRPRAVDFHEVFLDAVLGTGYEDDEKKVVSIIEEGRCHEHLEIRVIDDKLCSRLGISHILQNKEEIQGHISRGVFAKKAIPANTVLGEYAGRISFESKGSGEAERQYLWEISLVSEKTLYIDGAEETNELAFVNDYKGIKERPNCRMVPLMHRGRLRFCYATISQIAKDEEVVVAYHDKAVFN